MTINTDTFYGVASETAKNKPNNVSINFYNKTITYAQLINYIDTFASYLISIGITRGNVVTVCLPNTPSAAVVLYAINKVGAICHLVHPYIPKLQLIHDLHSTHSTLLISYDVYTIKNSQLTDIDIPVLLADTAYFMPLSAKIYFRYTNKGIKYNSYNSLEKCFFGESKAFPYAIFDEYEPALYLPSGGTTNSPKIIVHCCKSLNMLAAYAQDFVSRKVSEYKAMYSVLPIFHGFGLCMNMHLCIMHGLVNVMCVKFDADHLAKSIAKEQVNILTGVPAMYNKLVSNKRFNKTDLSSLVECFVGGDSVSKTLIEEFSSILSRQGSSGRLLGGYGLTEIIAAGTVNRIEHYKDDSIGYPLPFNKYAIETDGKLAQAGVIGQILVKSDLVMLGYLDNSETPFVTIDGVQYLATGDCGYIDEDGFLYYKQRIKNIVKVNGVPVFPSEVESLTDEVAGVNVSCAIGVADVNKGETINLIVELTEGAEQENVRAEILSKLTKNVIIYAVPTKIIFVDKLPLNSIGKVDRKAIETEYKKINQ